MVGSRIYSIGHSTRSEEEFAELLRSFGIVQLADIRALPGSNRYPQLTPENLEVLLPRLGIAYIPLPALGGRRRGLGRESPNQGWRNASFRAYADHMLSSEFAAGLSELLALPQPMTMMCAEAVPWRCHRSLVADALAAREISVLHITAPSQAPAHRLTPFARLEGGKLTYPAQR